MLLPSRFCGAGKTRKTDRCPQAETFSAGQAEKMTRARKEHSSCVYEVGAGMKFVINETKGDQSIASSR